MQNTDILRKIKRAVLTGRFEFSLKAAEELEADGLTEADIVESIVSAVAIYKTLRSRSLYKARRSEKIYIIISANLDGLAIYTKGKFVDRGGVEYFYLFISSKRSQAL
ncbi:MAG: hypothetical protein ACR2IE_19180 [Candidatus Sumerlaeaceae bacterium]